MARVAASPVTQRGYRAGLPSPRRGRRFPPEVLSPTEVRALFQACSNRAPTGIRNRALIVVMWRGGMRLGEALALKTSDVDAAAGTVSVFHCKGDKARTVGLDPTTMAVVDRWIERRRALGIRARELFCTLDGRSLHRSYVDTLLGRLARKVGIEKRVSPHALRHSHAAELARERVPTAFIRDQLGHSSLAVTDRYLRNILPIDFLEAMQRRSWSL